VPLDQSWAFRDCSWCGLRDAHLVVRTTFQTQPAGRESRNWTALGCPRCGKPTLIEDSMAGTNLLSVVPEAPSAADVAGLPPDIERHYLNAKRVLDAGVPDAAAVQLGRTLEAAAAHFGVDNGVLDKRIETLIEQGLVTKGLRSGVARCVSASQRRSAPRRHVRR
jgi:hypothetical protein